MPITSLPTPPSRTDAANFNARADAFLGALPTFATEANALATEVNGYVVSASSSAATAVNAPGTSATSTTSLAIGTGSKSLTVQTGNSGLILGQSGEHLVALMARAVAGLHAGVGFIDDDQLRAGAQELVAAAILLHIVETDHGDRVGIE